MEIANGKRRTEAFTEEGVTLAEVSVALPHCPGDDPIATRINRFYEGLAKGAIDIGKELLLPRSRARYKASDDPRRRFTHRPYRLELTAVCACRDDATEVKRTVTLFHRARRLYTETVTERITPEGWILPQRPPREKKPAKKG